MSGTRFRLLLALGAALALAGCGIGDDESTVPEANAETLLERLDAVEANVSDSNCALAVQQAKDFATEVEALPAEVDDELKQGLREGADRLVELAEDDTQCVGEGATGDGGVLEAEDPTAVETTTADTTTETDTAEAPPEEEEEAEPTPPEAPPEEELTPPSGDGGEESGGDDGGGESGTLNETGGIGGGGG